MNKIRALLAAVALPFLAFGQYQTDSIVSLKSPLTESSGLLYLNGSFITHNDSGGEPELYEIDSLTGLPSRTVYISNATNIDWEDIAADDDYIYIGDFGNNQGTRQNLRIYKVSLVDYWMNDTVFADTINFSYADQSSFTPMPFQTDYDAEGLISKGDSLYVFTKQWTTTGSTVYALPKTSGTYSVPIHDFISFPSGLATAADYYEPLGMLVLMLNSANQPFMHMRYNIPGNDFSLGVNGGNTMLMNGSIQVEGVTMVDTNRFYFTSEEFLGQKPMLSVLRNKNPAFTLPEIGLPKGTVISPNPASDNLSISSNSLILGVMVLNLNGQVVLKSTESAHIDVSGLPSGLYLISIQTEREVLYERLIKL